MENLKQTLKSLFELSLKLEKEYEEYERKFTLDGHLFGSIGEVFAAKKYNLKLLKSSIAGHDAEDKNGNLVQIKITQRGSVGLRKPPQKLLVFKLNKETFDFETIYYGDGKIPWKKSNKKNSAGQRIITLNKLKEIKKTSPITHSLPPPLFLLGGRGAERAVLSISFVGQKVTCK